MERRVLVIGLDGATWDLVQPWIDQGKLPNLAKLQSEGASAELLSTIHPVTTPAWISFLTGRTQGQHGVYDHVQRRQNNYSVEIMDATKIKSPLIFDYLGKSQLKSISINVPQTYPPPTISGSMVSGLFGTITGTGITEPSTLFKRINEVAPSYVVHPDFHPRAEDPLKKYIEDLSQSVSDRTRVTEMLLKEEDWQFAIVVYTATDQIQHAFWHLMEDETANPLYKSAIFKIYEQIDKDIEKLLRHVDEDTLTLVVSDHGAGRLHAIVNLNRWLSDEGFLKFHSNSNQSIKSHVITWLATRYKNNIPAKVRASIRRNFQNGFTYAKERMESEFFDSAIDWQNTTVYSLGACGNIFINMIGREPHGCIEAGAEYEALRDLLIERLQLLKNPQGDLIVKSVYRREVLYHGEFLGDAPDLIIVWNDYGYWGRARNNQSNLPLFQEPSTWDFSSLPLTGSHRPEGVLIAHGQGVKKGLHTSSKLIDIAPTIMAFLGVPIPNTLDGEVLSKLFIQDVLRLEFFNEEDMGQNSNDFSFSEKEETQIMEHLKNLGYL